MNNMKSLSIILLLSLGATGFSFAESACSTDCSTSSSDSGCSTDCSTDSEGTSTFLRPRQSTTDLTYLNNLSFYNRYHEARCNFFTWDATLFYQKNRSEKDLGVGFFGKNPIIVSESAPSDFNSINLGLGRNGTKNFSSTVSIHPERSVIGWLAHGYFNLDFFVTGLWADVAFTVAQAKHKLHFKEVGNEGNIVGNASTVADAFANRNVFAADCKHTGVDDVLLRIGYDYNYCDNDHAGLYFLGIAPTGKDYNNARWFQPLVGSQQGAVGAGFEMDYTIWSSDNNDLVFQTELLYQYRLRSEERRTFDYKNGSLSRFLLVASATNTENPVSGLSQLENCVRVEPRSQLEWWANFHYQWCNWAAEVSYNLWFRDAEKVSYTNFDFENTGIFLGNCKPPALTSCSTATIATLPLTGTADAVFTGLKSSDVNLHSGAAQKALTHKFSGAVAYNNVFADCYPFYVGLGAGYEFASCKYRRHALENWSVYGKWGISW
jgi:hypothetical protein